MRTIHVYVKASRFNVCVGEGSYEFERETDLASHETLTDAVNEAKEYAEPLDCKIHIFNSLGQVAHTIEPKP
jgi:hypothetical protein